VRESEWIHLSQEQLDADPTLADAIARFRAPSRRAGEAAETWLSEHAFAEAAHIATYVFLVSNEIAAFYSLGMSEVELRTKQRQKLELSHPRLGAVLILWLARADGADVDAETILAHAVGIAQIGARHVGAAVVALDPYDAEADRFWRDRFGFRSSLTRRRDADGTERSRLWMPLLPEGWAGCSARGRRRVLSAT
jgi:hypothetical protein